MSVKRVYGWRPDVGDSRDLVMPKLVPAIALPPSVDLSAKCGPVLDQGSLGSCTAHALSGAVAYNILQQTGQMFNLSRLFSYYNARALAGHVNFDSGTYIRTVIKLGAKQGFCPEDMWAYNIKLFTRTPPRECYEEALKHQIIMYQRVTQSEQGLCSVLAAGQPIVFGFSVYENFKKVGEDGLLGMPGKTERMLGGHAVLLVGYDTAKRLYKIRNSYGPKWGAYGHFYMPFDYIHNDNLAADFWSIMTMEVPE